MNITALSNYFENLAAQHASIQHSPESCHYFADMTELMDKLRAGGKNPIVVLGPPEFQPVDDTMDNLQENNLCTLLILDFVPAKSQTKSEKFAAYDYCKAIAMDFISRIKRDEYEQTEGVLFTDLNRYMIEPVGPIMDNYYGVQLDLEFTDNQINIDYDQTKWID